jgi:multidrug efflux pump subunit AcrA (membrane-fusion protein)
MNIKYFIDNHGKIIFHVYPIIAFFILLIGCSKNENPNATVPLKPTVVSSQPVQHEIVEWDEYTGRLEAVESVEIRSRVSGYLK